jgi:hypothetical protein
MVPARGFNVQLFTPVIYECFVSKSFCLWQVFPIESNVYG